MVRGQEHVDDARERRDAVDVAEKRDVCLRSNTKKKKKFKKLEPSRSSYLPETTETTGICAKLVCETCEILFGEQRVGVCNGDDDTVDVNVHLLHLGVELLGSPCLI